MADDGLTESQLRNIKVLLTQIKQWWFASGGSKEEQEHLDAALTKLVELSRDAR
jgi:hypothetical protein